MIDIEYMGLDTVTNQMYQIEYQLKTTKEDQEGPKPFIEAVYTGVMLGLQKRLERCHKRISELKDIAEVKTDDYYVQSVAPFYYECSIDEDEIPF